jgi:hypothetical protein
MKQIFCLLFIILRVSCGAFAQGKDEVWSRVKVLFSNGLGMKELSALGLDTDHGQYKSGKWFLSEFSNSEIKRIREAGFETEVLVSDVRQHFLNRNAKSDLSVQSEYYDPSCNRSGKYKVPENWRFGSMGGHLTYKEMLNQLDSMRARFPSLITVRAPIDTFKTENDSSLWFVRISDLPDLDEPQEPQALFTALHHAREPVGMHQLIFFMWYLLENYADNNEIKNLVNNSALYFIPCLNPDGYRHNETEFPDGGGMWRKNRRKNSDFSYGVDLNRNYGFRWGNDDIGSSPEPSTDIYRGTGPFSEPETQAVRLFCMQHPFKIALNYHTFANILLHPWGYDGTTINPDSSHFRQLGSELARKNNFRVGNCLELLNYNSNGSSDDYMYAPEPSKPSIFALTPEVGNEFWPSQNEIIPLCIKTIHQNLSAVRSLHPMLAFEDLTGVFHRPGFGADSGACRLKYRITRVGTNNSPCDFQLTFSAFGQGTEGLPLFTKNYSNLNLGESFIDSILIPEGDLSMLYPDPVNWDIGIINQLYQTHDTVVHYGGYPFSNDNLLERCDNITNWTGPWVISEVSPQEGTGNLKTSEGNYGPGLRTYMRRNRFVDLRSPDIHSAELSFYTRFRVEKNYDMASLQFSTDSGANWIPVCTNKTVFSSPFSNQAGVDANFQDTITPVWDGYQNDWRHEIIDLKDFLGNKLWIRFHFRSDEFTEDAGFEVDNMRFRLGYTITSAPELYAEKRKSLHIFPNPGNAITNFVVLGFPSDSDLNLRVRDARGRLIFTQKVRAGNNLLDGSGLLSGCYFVEIQDAEKESIRQVWFIR